MQADVGMRPLRGAIQRDSKVSFVDLLSVFPGAFSLASVLIFALPVTKAIAIATDVNVTFWLGRALLFCTILAMLFLVVASAVHWGTGRPSKFAVVVALVGTSSAIMLGGNFAMTQAMSLSLRFSSTDCSSFPGKYALERDWQEAFVFHKDCSGRRSGETGYRIQDCAGYETMSKGHNWEYLAQLEQDYDCAGWCTAARRPLWRLSGRTGLLDPCSSVVAGIFNDRVRPVGLQLVVFGVGLLLLTALLLTLLGPALRRRGIDW